MYLLWNASSMKRIGALEGNCSLLLIEWQEWVERINGHERETLWWKPQIHYPANIHGQQTLFFKSRLVREERFCWKACVCVCVGGGELFEVIAQYFPLTIKYKLYTTPQFVLKMFGTSRIFCCPLEKRSLLGRCWGTVVFYKDSLFIHPKETREF